MHRFSGIGGIKVAVGEEPQNVCGQRMARQELVPNKEQASRC